MTDKPKPVQIALTNGAALLLAQLVGGIGVTGTDDIYRIGGFADAHLSDLPPAPERPGKDATAPEVKAWDEAHRAWSRVELPVIEITERTKESFKKLLKTAAEKGAIPGVAAARRLLAEFGLGVED